MLSTAGVRDLAASLVSDELVVVPVRHHSPACAWQVRRAVEEHRPSVVLVEGPRSLTPLVPLLTHPEARMPLSVYTWAVRGRQGAPVERWSAQLPFCDYSPELVALREAAARGIPVRFIDLDLAEQSLLGTREYDPDTEEPLLDEHHYRTSARLQALAEKLGCRDHEDLWEHLIEADAAAAPAAEHTARVAAWCQLARQDHPAAELDRDGTTAREAEMAWHITQALTGRNAGDGPVLVVVGGFHAVALPALLAEPPARPQVRADGVTGGAAVVRYTFERLERLNGYASGMTSPAWHQQLWQLMTDGAEDPRAHAALSAILDVAEELRRREVPVPMPAVSAAFEQALRLAHLRDRPAPLRSDLVDAVTSCFVKGDADVEGALVGAVTRHVLTGTAVGTVPPGAGTPPLVADALGRLRRQRLHVDGEPRTAALDLYRRPAHRETSRLLHGLALLGVPFAIRTAGPDFVHGHGLGRLQERWEYRWSPATDGALAEASVLGETLPAAVATRFEALLEAERARGARSAPAATSLLVRACVLGLHDHLGEPLELVREALAADVAFDALAAATAQLALLREAREPLEARALEPLPALLRTAYERTVFLGRELSGQECAPPDAVTALVGLREVLLGEVGSGLDADLYWQMVDRLSSAHEAPLVRGGATGLRYSAGRLGAGWVARAIAGHLSGTASAADGVGFVSGLLRTAREAAWQEPALLGALDGRLGAWDRETFVAHLPELRLAFAGMTPRETDRIAQAVAALHGATDLGVLRRSDVDEGTVRRHLEVSRVAADLLARDGLAAWGAGA